MLIEFNITIFFNKAANLFTEWNGCYTGLSFVSFSLNEKQNPKSS